MVHRELESIVQQKPILWIGAVFLIAAGHPSTGAVLSALRAVAGRHLPDGEFTARGVPAQLDASQRWTAGPRPSLVRRIAPRPRGGAVGAGEVRRGGGPAARVAGAHLEGGAPRPSLCPTLANLAVIPVYQGRGREGIPLVERGPRIGYTVLGQDHPSVQHTLNLLHQLRGIK